MNPCSICLDEATAGDDYPPRYKGNTYTCSSLIEGVTKFKSGSDVRRLYYDIDVTYCCPDEVVGNSACMICPDGDTGCIQWFLV